MAQMRMLKDIDLPETQNHLLTQPLELLVVSINFFLFITFLKYNHFLQLVAIALDKNAIRSELGALFCELVPRVPHPEEMGRMEIPFGKPLPSTYEVAQKHTAANRKKYLYATMRHYYEHNDMIRMYYSC